MHNQARVMTGQALSLRIETGLCLESIKYLSEDVREVAVFLKRWASSPGILLQNPIFLGLIVMNLYVIIYLIFITT